MRPAENQTLCPLCRSVAQWEGNPNRPFCSRQCKATDLHNWLNNSYAIPGEPASDRGDSKDGKDRSS